MKQVLPKEGLIIVEYVPAPIAGSGSVLVEVRYSVISTGTETAVVAASEDLMDTLSGILATW